MFKLSPLFLARYEGKQPRWGFGDLSYFVYKRTYARIKPDGTQEEYFDTCRRVTEGVFNAQKSHCTSNRLPWNAYKSQKSAQEFFTRMWQFKFTPPGRGFWIMGTPMVDKVGSAALNNCLSGDTKIYTSTKGLVEISSLVNEKIGLLTKEGWRLGEIKSYGKQPLNTITMAPAVYQNTHGGFYRKLRSNLRKTISATPNHKWVLANGDFTTELRERDVIASVSAEWNSTGDINYEAGFIHGLIFGDGTAGYEYTGSDERNYFVRLCGEKSKFAYLPWHRITHPESYNGDPICNIRSDKDLKKLPQTKNRGYITGFIRGYIAADGNTKDNGNVRLSSQNHKAIKWLNNYAVYAGYIPTGISTESCQETNFGKRANPLKVITLSKQEVVWRVESITEGAEDEEVFCAEVPSINAFAIEGGIYTGNCGFTSTKDVAVDLANSFAWAMDMLMLGVGIGFDTKGAGSITIKKPKDKVELYQIPDSREGWVESVYRKINSYTGGPTIEFDYSLIRKQGEPIRGFGGTASGPGPLKELHEAIDYILSGLIGKKITSVAIVDLMNFIGKCVVAGNVRRSAELAIGEIDDISYVTMKDSNKYGKEMDDRRWASNNSVFADKFSSFGTVAPNIALNGEPGLIFLDNARHYGRFKDGYHSFESDAYDNVDGFNPCAEQSLEDKELCCLVETYPANHESAEDYYRTLKFAYMYAKTVTLIPTHDERTNSVMMRNRRIGCSMSGIQQALKKFGLQRFLTDFCDKGYKVIGSLDRIYSRWLGVPRSVKMTTVKPSGTVSLLAGATPGIHYTHSEHYMRAVRVGAGNAMMSRILAAGYQVEYNLNGRDLDLLTKLLSAEECLTNCSTEHDAKDWIKANFRDVRTNLPLFNKFKNNGGTVVVYFPVKETNFTKSKFDVSIWEQLSLVRELQYYWSDNSVSCTVTVREGERDDIERAIEYFAPYVKTLSFLPLTNHKYDQAPYQEVDAETYDEYNESLLPLNFEGADEKKIKGSNFCTNDTCAI